MNWNDFYDSVGDIDNAFMVHLGACIGHRPNEHEVFDLFATLFAYPI